MIITKDIPSAVDAVNQLKKQNATIALVPTMGNLHEGHLTLVREAKKIADKVAVSVFVNPLQFNNADDLKNYPRTLDQDLAKLEQENVDLVFTPTPQTMYPNGMENQTTVFVPHISDKLEGKLNKCVKQNDRLTAQQAKLNGQLKELEAKREPLTINYNGSKLRADIDGIDFTL